MPDNDTTFHDSVSKLLSTNLSEYLNEPLNLALCVKIYQSIFETLVEVFQNSNINVSNESMNYLAQQYYDAVKINNTHDLDPNIFTQRAKLENIETKEIALLAVMLKGTDFAYDLLSEIKKRG